MPRILIVDDVPLIRRLVRQALDPQHEIREAATALEAWDTALEFLPDLVVLDISLPGPMDGLDLLAHMRIHPRLHAMPVVILSGHGLQGETCGLPVDAYFTKPFRVTELIACIEGVLDKTWVATVT